MTTAPKYPLLHSYLDDGDPMEIVDNPFGAPMEREKAKAIATVSSALLLSLARKSGMILQPSLRAKTHVKQNFTHVLTPSVRVNFSSLSEPLRFRIWRGELEKQSIA